jgi:hypothetical protein
MVHGSRIKIYMVNIGKYRHIRPNKMSIFCLALLASLSVKDGKNDQKETFSLYPFSHTFFNVIRKVGPLLEA